MDTNTFLTRETAIGVAQDRANLHGRPYFVVKVALFCYMVLSWFDPEDEVLFTAVPPVYPSEY